MHQRGMDVSQVDTAAQWELRKEPWMHSGFEGSLFYFRRSRNCDCVGKQVRELAQITFASSASPTATPKDEKGNQTEARESTGPTLERAGLGENEAENGSHFLSCLLCTMP